MENILQSIVKIIIIGSFYENINTKANRQFLPPLPPLPYFHNEGYVPPGFAIPYREPIPIYYQDDSAPPPISYQNMNSYAPAQLFRQNENYNPLHAANPGSIYPTPQVLPYNPAFRPPHKPQVGVNIGISQFNYKKPSQTQQASNERPGDASPKKTAFYGTNIIVKEEHHPPYYNDDYGKNYHEDEYSDNYSDDISSPLEPCLNSPYRYFERAKPNPNKFNVDNRYNLCNPNFQPNFGNGVYTVKMPITLLPSRFPPRVEELIERIQNYFSTYTQQETPKPQNQTTTTTTTTVKPTTEAASQSQTQSAGMVEANNKKNTTAEIEELNLELNNAGAPETAAGEGNHPENGTQEIVIAEIEKVGKKEESTSTSEPNSQGKEELQIPEHSTTVPTAKDQSAPNSQAKEEPQIPVHSTTGTAVKENSATGIPTTTELLANPQTELRDSQQDQSKSQPTMHPLHMSSQGNEIMRGWSPGVGIQTGSPQTQTVFMGHLATTGSTEVTNISGETTTVQPIINVTDSKD